MSESLLNQIVGGTREAKVKLLKRAINDLPKPGFRRIMIHQYRDHFKSELHCDHEPRYAQEEIDAAFAATRLILEREGHLNGQTHQ